MYNLDKTIKDELNSLSMSLYKSKTRWEKMLNKGLTVQTPNSKEKHIETRYGKRILRVYSQQYFSSVTELLEYMRAEKLKRDIVIEDSKKVDKAV